MQNLYGIGFKGELLALDSLYWLKERDCKRPPSEYPLLTPHVELALPHLEPRVYEISEQNWEQELRDLVARVYKLDFVYGKKCYGPFGDVISVSVLTRYPRDGKILAFINWIAPKAFFKPGLAADTIVIVSNGLEWYWIGIVRGGDHANGAIAPVGGFLDIEKTVLESPLSAAARETGEEISVYVTAKRGAQLAERELLSRDIHNVDVTFGGTSLALFPGTLQFVGAYSTEDEYVTERPYGLKRVYWAFGHVLHVEFPKTTTLSCEMLREMCKAGDDASAIFVQNLFESGGPSFPKFLVGHHRKIFGDACYALVARGKFPAFQKS